MKLFSRRRNFYDGMTSDEFMQFQEDMYHIGFDYSAWMGDYGKATCENCRAVVRVGVPAMTGLYYGKQHRIVCGDAHLFGLVRDQLPERLEAIGDWWRDRAAAGRGEKP